MRRYSAAFGSALALNLAYPPLHLLVPSFVCLVPVIVALERAATGHRGLRAALELGGVFGLLAYGVTLHWMAPALWGHQPLWSLGFVAVVLLLAAATALTFGFIAWLRARTGLPLLVILPLAWTAQEWAAARAGPLAYGWLGLGTSLTGYPALIQVADLIGARGITFLLAAANTALALAWMRRKGRRSLVPAGAVALGAAVAILYGWLRLRSLEFRTGGRVAAVQTAVPRDPRLAPRDPAEVPLRLSRGVSPQQPDLIVWPESALPQALLYAPHWATALGNLAREERSFVVVGGTDAVPTGTGVTSYNAAFLFRPDGRLAPEAVRKRWLVPLVERGGGTASGTRDVILETRYGRVAVLLCGEAMFEQAPRRYRRLGAVALLNPSNDAWLAGTVGQAQHAAHSVMRAIETRMSVARAANSGRSQVVDPTGRVVSQVAPGRNGVAMGVLRASANLPLYVRMGDWIGTLSAVALVVLASIALAGHRSPGLRRALDPGH